MKRAISFLVIGIVVTVLFFAVTRNGNLDKGGQLASLMPKEHGLHLVIADTEDKRRKGLSGIAQLPKEIGMLFVFDAPQVQCMWNKDVSFAVDVAFFTADWKMVNLETMPPHDRKKTCSTDIIKYAVETNVGILRKENK